MCDAGDLGDPLGRKVFERFSKALEPKGAVFQKLGVVPTGVDDDMGDANLRYSNSNPNGPMLNQERE